MTSEEDEFKAIISQLEDPEEQELKRTSDIILAELAQLRADFKTADDAIEPNKKLYEHWNAEVKRLDEILNKARKERNQYEQAMADAKRKAKNIQDKMAIKERELARLRMLEAEREGFLKAAQKMLDDTINRPWREWALDHQITGAQALAFAGRGLLADKMGLGKSLTSLIYADMVKAKRLIVMAPKDVLNNFSHEVMRWAPDRYIIPMVSIPKINRDMFLKSIIASDLPQFIILVNLEAWRKDPELIDTLIGVQADCVIIDEAHNIKNVKGNAFEGVQDIVYAHNKCHNINKDGKVCGHNEFSIRRVTKPGQNYPSVCWHCDKCEHITWDEADICSVKNVLPMTGTPLLNRPQELWPSLYLVDKKVFPTENAFLYDYCEQVCPEGDSCSFRLEGRPCKHSKRWKFQYGGLERLQKKIGNKFIMRDRHAAGVIIPPQTVQEYDIEFDKTKYADQWHAYKMVARGVVQMINDAGAMGELPIPAFITMLLRFRQIMVWPAGVELKDEYGNVIYRCAARQSMKLDKAETLIKDIVATGERVVLFSQFKPPLEELQRRLNNHYLVEDEKTIRSVVFNGDTNAYLREQIATNFDRKNESSRNSKWDVVLANYRVGGTGLNLTAATHMILTDREWNPGKEDQALARIDRIGQTQETTVHRINTVSEELKDEGILLIDEFMDDLMQFKKNVVDGFETSSRGMTAKFLEMLNKIKDK